MRKKINNFDNYSIDINGTVWNDIRNKPLKASDNGNGYMRVSLHKEGEKKTYTKYIHQLLAEAFIPNPNNLTFVDHIDTDRKNNNIDNLRWVTSKENTNNPLTLEKIHLNNHQKKQKQIVAYKENEILYFNSIIDASEKLGILKSSICNCLNGRSKTSGGYMWKY